MANKEELKTMIKCFRVHELQILLSFAGRSKSGKKQELQDRALTLLKLQSEPLSFKIRQLYYLMQNGYSSNSMQYPCSEINLASSFLSGRNDDVDKPYGNEEDSIAIIDDTEYQGKNSFKQLCADLPNADRCTTQSNSSVQLKLNSLYCSNHPVVIFKKLPFYKVLYELLKPTRLVFKESQIQQKNSFKFYLTPQQVAAIKLSNRQVHSAHRECLVQGQLRFCSLDSRSDKEDCFPPGLGVWVNNVFCNIQELSRRKGKDSNNKTMSPPINITPLMKITAKEENTINVQWNPEYGLLYMIAVYIVKKKTWEDLLNRLNSKGFHRADLTKKMIQDKLKEEADSEIVTTSLHVSLTCPLGKTRLMHPCRASTCQHLQCFDASLFLKMNEKTPTWMCPVCDKPAEYEKLVIDEYFLEILSSDKLPSCVNEIELHKDGSWSTVPVRGDENCTNDGSDNAKAKHCEEVIDVPAKDCEENPTRLHTSENSWGESSSSNNNNNKSESTMLEKRKVDEIDLTVSDDGSENESFICHKRRETSKNKRNRVVNSRIPANPTQNYPLVINLEDSDSSDSFPLVISNSGSATPTPPNSNFSNGNDVAEFTDKADEIVMP